jgi:hypothetical protein
MQDPARFLRLIHQHKRFGICISDPRCPHNPSIMVPGPVYIASIIWLQPASGMRILHTNPDVLTHWKLQFWELYQSMRHKLPLPKLCAVQTLIPQEANACCNRGPPASQWMKESASIDARSIIQRANSSCYPRVTRMINRDGHHDYLGTGF